MIAKLKAWRAALEVYLEERILVLILLGFVSGLPLALVVGTLFIWMREVGVEISTIGLFALVGMPYSLKFLWAPVLERVPIPFLCRRFGQRRGWILAIQVLLIAAIVLLGTSDPLGAPAATAALAFTVAVLSASQDIAIDAFRIESLEEEEQAAGAAAAVFGYRIGMLVSGAGALHLADDFDWGIVYGAMAALILIGTATVLYVREPRPEKNEEARAIEQKVEAWIRAKNISPGLGARILGWLYVTVAAPFVEFLSRKPSVLYSFLILVFIVLYKVGDAFAGTMTNPFLIDIGFTKAEIANMVKLFGFAATIAGLAFGGVLMKRYGTLITLWISGVLQLLSNFLFSVQAMLGDHLAMLGVTIGVENFTSGMGMAVIVAFLSTLCRVPFTATQYALLSALAVSARTIMSSGSGFLAEETGWFWFFIITAIIAVPGLVMLWVLSHWPGGSLVPRQRGKAAPE